MKKSNFINPNLINDDLTKTIAVEAKTGQGKTHTILNHIVKPLIQSNSALIYIDIKGDTPTSEEIKNFAIQENRLNDFILNNKINQKKLKKQIYDTLNHKKILILTLPSLQNSRNSNKNTLEIIIHTIKEILTNGNRCDISTKNTTNIIFDGYEERNPLQSHIDLSIINENIRNLSNIGLTISSQKEISKSFDIDILITKD
ncbi:MAG: hypothetical protein U9O87_09235 [Verrucomicrobiota bacterium]|nr:hypothetical protein [Verrucomicrobiota bacterium]